MFSIYGVTGQVFSGTLEEMIRVRALARARSARAIAQEGDEPGVELVAGSANRPRDEAVRAYHAMLPPELERGPLYRADQIMQRQVISVSAAVMLENRVAGVPITSKAGRVYWDLSRAATSCARSSAIRP